MKFAKLRGKIREKFQSESRFAQLMGISKQSMSHKLTGKFGWSIDDIERAVKLLDISKAEIGDYFFEQEV